MQTEFHKKYTDAISGTISCFDRMIISGSLIRWNCPFSMTAFMIQERIHFTSFPQYAKQISQKIKDHIEGISSTEGIPVYYIRKPRSFNKEKAVEDYISENGRREGIVKIFSSMEVCDGYDYRWDYQSQKGSIISKTSKCIHYYIYFIDKYLGLCFMRIPTWIPCRVEVYFNGHNLLAGKFRKNHIEYKTHDNVFTYISDYQKGQEISDDLRAKDLHNWLDVFALRYIPFLKETQQSFNWTIAQAEYSTDIIFKKPEDLRLLYQELILRAIHTVKPDNIATFFNRALAAHFSGEVTTKYNNKIQGTRVKHSIGANSVKMYDKAPGILRIETTINKVTDFKVFREVKDRNGHITKKFAAMKKSIYSLYPLSKESLAVNSRYLDFLASFDDNSAGKKDLNKVTATLRDEKRSYRGFNFFDSNDEEVLLVLNSGEFVINGLRNKHLRAKLCRKLSAASVSRILMRLYIHGLIKKVRNTYKYYITKFGRRVIQAALATREFSLVPILAKSA